MSKENDHKKIEFLRQALERISVYPYVTTGDAALKGIAISWLEQYQQLCLELDAEELNINKLSKQISMPWPGKLVEDHEV